MQDRDAHGRPQLARVTSKELSEGASFRADVSPLLGFPRPLRPLSPLPFLHPGCRGCPAGAHCLWRLASCPGASLLLQRESSGDGSAPLRPRGPRCSGSSSPRSSARTREQGRQVASTPRPPPCIVQAPQVLALPRETCSITCPQVSSPSSFHSLLTPLPKLNSPHPGPCLKLCFFRATG